ncbi:MAG: hypothetical protein EPN22_11685 [Nitrospirae bacterium]|nr:MAG: hypothetical protein EPN22_11685 [Nitrospirota bacterium]
MTYRDIKTACLFFFVCLASAMFLIAAPAHAREAKAGPEDVMQKDEESPAVTDKFFDRNWKLYFSKDSFTYFYDTNSVLNPAEGFVSVWTQKLEQKLVKVEALTSINCADKQYSLLQVTVLEGEHVRASILNNPWLTVKAFSAEDALHSALCKGLVAARTEKAESSSAGPVGKQISKKDTRGYKAYGKEERGLLVSCSKKDMKSCRAYYNRFIKKSVPE